MIFYILFLHNNNFPPKLLLLLSVLRIPKLFKVMVFRSNEAAQNFDLATNARFAERPSDATQNSDSSTNEENIVYYFLTFFPLCLFPSTNPSLTIKPLETPQFQTNLLVSVNNNANTIA